MHKERVLTFSFRFSLRKEKRERERRNSNKEQSHKTRRGDKSVSVVKGSEGSHSTLK